jgi:tetratricopeptide (TPR) repeat protein
MNSPILDKLIEFYKEDPEDPFNLYALALEYQKIDTSEAKRCFELLLTRFPAYLPTYYHAAQFFSGLEQIEFTESIYQKGIQLAQDQRNLKAQQELLRAYRSFQDEQMDW